MKCSTHEDHTEQLVVLKTKRKE